MEELVPMQLVSPAPHGPLSGSFWDQEVKTELPASLQHQGEQVAGEAGQQDRRGWEKMDFTAYRLAFS